MGNGAILSTTGFSVNEMHTGAIWLQKNGIAAVKLLGEVAVTVLFPLIIRTYVCMYRMYSLTGSNPAEKGGNTNSTTTLCYWHDKHNQYVRTKWLQYVEVNMATINKEYTLLFNMITSSAVQMTRTHSVMQCVSMECIR